MSDRPDLAKTLGSAGCLLLLIPVVLVLAALFVAIAVGGGITGVMVAIGLLAIVGLVVERSRRPRTRPWRCPRCGGVFAAGLRRCPHCDAAVGPPG